MRESVITHLERIKPKGRQNKQYSVCACLCKNQSLRVSLAFGCQQLRGDAESVPASAQGGRPAPFGAAIPTHGSSELSPAAKKLAEVPRARFPARPCPPAAPLPRQRAAGLARWQPGVRAEVALDPRASMSAWPGYCPGRWPKVGLSPGLGGGPQARVGSPARGQALQGAAPLWFLGAGQNI